MSYFINKFFHFKGYFVQKAESNDSEITIHLSPRRKTAVCPSCEKRTKNIYEQGKPRKIKHSKYEGKIVLLSLPQRRFFCSLCKKTFNERVDFAEPRARTTRNFASETICALSRSSFETVCESYHTSYSFLANHLKKIDFNDPWPKGELRLGFDEHAYGKRHMMITICELRSRKLLAILPNYSKEAVIRYLEKRTEEEKARVVELCFDMKFKQQRTAEGFFPNAKVVIDKFHVLSYAANLIDADRRIICPGIGRYKYENLKQTMRKPRWKLAEKQKEYLNKIFEEYPELKERWNIYQKLCLFYKSMDKEEGRERLKEVRESIENLDRSSYLYPFIGTLTRLEEEILNYFDNRTTNAFTEGVHTKIKMLKRTSFGFRNIDIYIKKMMLSFLPFLVISSLFLPR